MNYPIPSTPDEIRQLCNQPVNAELVATVMLGVVTWSQQGGQSLDDLLSQVMADDSLLTPEQRRWLGKLVSRAWQTTTDSTINGAIAPGETAGAIAA